MAPGILYTVKTKYGVPYNGRTYIDRLNNVAGGSSSYPGYLLGGGTLKA